MIITSDNASTLSLSVCLGDYSPQRNHKKLQRYFCHIRLVSYEQQPRRNAATKDGYTFVNSVAAVTLWCLKNDNVYFSVVVKIEFIGYWNTKFKANFAQLMQENALFIKHLNACSF